AQIKLSAAQQRPRNILGSEEMCPALEFECAAVVDPVLVHRANEVVLNSAPTFPQQAERCGVDWYAVELHGCGCSHVAPAQQCARQIDARQYGRQQSLERRHVALAVVEDRDLLIMRPWTSRQDQRAQFVLLLAAARIEPEER